MAEKFYILCLEKEQEISRIIHSVYRDLDYKLECFHSPEEVINRLKEGTVKLLLINNAVAHFSQDRLQQFKKAHAGLYIIVIDRSPEPETLEVQQFRFAGSDELSTKLPLLLSEIYSIIADQLIGGMPYWQALQDSLEKLRDFVVVVSSSGEFVFVNKVGRTFFGLDEDNSRTLQLQDFLVDGSKSWNFIKENCCESQREESRFLMKFINKDRQSFNKNIYVSKVRKDHEIWLLQEVRTDSDGEDVVSETDSLLLEKFADSVANELLNPVNVISGRLHLLKQELGAQWQNNKNLEAINRQIGRQSEIISKLLTFARLKNDFIPQKVHLNEVLQRLKLEPSVSRLLQRSNVRLDYSLSKNPVVLLGQISHFDLLLKTLLEVGFDCVGTGGRIRIKTVAEDDGVSVRFELRYPESLVGNKLTLLSFLGGFKSSPKKKSIETTIIRQIIQQYHGTYSLSQGDTYTENLNMHFPYSQFTN